MRKRATLYDVRLTEADALVLLFALQSYRGRWHDGRGFRWMTKGAERLNGELSALLELDPAELAVPQAQEHPDYYKL